MDVIEDDGQRAINDPCGDQFGERECHLAGVDRRCWAAPERARDCIAKTRRQSTQFVVGDGAAQHVEAGPRQRRLGLAESNAIDTESARSEFVARRLDER